MHIFAETKQKRKEENERQRTAEPMRAIGLKGDVEASMAYTADIIRWWALLHCFRCPLTSLLSFLFSSLPFLFQWSGASHRSFRTMCSGWTPPILPRQHVADQKGWLRWWRQGFAEILGIQRRRNILSALKGLFALFQLLRCYYRYKYLIKREYIIPIYLKKKKNLYIFLKLIYIYIYIYFKT